MFPPAVETVNGRDAESAARLARCCCKGKSVALFGSSGVGKSTLVNTLRGSDSIATQPIRAGDVTGRHTITVREMHPPAHGSEPGCAVRAAIAEGILPLVRFDRWQKLAAEERVTHARRTTRPR